MSQIAFVTDSTCNMPADLLARHQITVVPVYVLFGEQAYKDYEEIPPADFYRLLVEYKASGKGMPTTSQPSPEDFREAYTRLVAQGFSEAISIHVSAKSSGTYQSAELAKSMVKGIEIHVVDSASTSMHMGFMLLGAIQAVQAGGGVAEALAAIDRVKAHSSIYFTVTDLGHLAASGRTEGHEKATEAALSVKPVVSIVEGVPKAIGTERTTRAALEKVLGMAKKDMGNASPRRLAIVNGNIPDRAAQWAEEATSVLGFTRDPYIVDFGPALAVHFGPGLLGVALEWD